MGSAPANLPDPALPGRTKILNANDRFFTASAYLASAKMNMERARELLEKRLGTAALAYIHEAVGAMLKAAEDTHKEELRQLTTKIQETKKP